MVACGPSLAGRIRVQCLHSVPNPHLEMWCLPGAWRLPGTLEPSLCQQGNFSETVATQVARSFGATPGVGGPGVLHGHFRVWKGNLGHVLPRTESSLTSLLT